MGVREWLGLGGVRSNVLSRVALWGRGGQGGLAGVIGQSALGDMQAPVGRQLAALSRKAAAGAGLFNWQAAGARLGQEPLYDKDDNAGHRHGTHRSCDAKYPKQ